MKGKAGHLSKIWFLNIGILLFAIILVAKLGYIQIEKGEMYRDIALSQYTLPSDGAFDRGTIFFEEKTGRRISAATVIPDYTLSIDPSKITNANALADKLAPIVSFDREEFLVKASNPKDRDKEIAKHLTDEQVASATDLIDEGEKAIFLKKDKMRFYPGGKTAANVLGFVGSNGTIITGQYGLERYYNGTLKRSDSDNSSTFFADLFMKAGKTIISDSGEEGDIVTTIEPTVQGMLERVLTDEVYKKYSAAGAMGIIMNPQNGEIYAMATTPTFDPNNFSKEKSPSVFVNPLVEGVYEMGSIIKPLTIAAGLDAGVITASTTYDDQGFRVFNGYRISNWDGKGHGIIPIQEVLNQSLNTGTVFTMERLGHQSFKDYFKAYGFDQETGIDLPNEGVGDMENLNSPQDIGYATASFGQGISTTPIATIRALSALGNGGILVTPHIVKETDYGLGISHTFVLGGERRVIKKETSQEISRMLTVVVDKALLGGSVKQEHYSIAAKTGTAQEVVDGKYSDTDFLHTFFGYFPSYNPKFIILLIAKNPRGEEFGSHTLTAPFIEITKFLLNYYEVPPDR
ncbi:MAG: penicillin-binding protein 2 [Candidatus Pacebacteria bacterium]|nr:penicillin-binding protein 2 [Candidatus Paceibacterota bacterium]